MLFNLPTEGMAAEDGPWLSGPFGSAGIDGSSPTAPALHARSERNTMGAHGREVTRYQAIPNGRRGDIAPGGRWLKPPPGRPARRSR